MKNPPIYAFSIEKLVNICVLKGFLLHGFLTQWKNPSIYSVNHKYLKLSDNFKIIAAYEDSDSYKKIFL